MFCVGLRDRLTQPTFSLLVAIALFLGRRSLFICEIALFPVGWVEQSETQHLLCLFLGFIK
jgi:hypothetical protein